ncbi:Phosphoribosylformimino-5-aminoimidazole carboxamide ribotide isomerase [Mycena amicta]|nr:Phosphoribosylformimino-5-aminoimidazole carboxamide ribotide isomerase [Mycena amicta]
MFRPCIDLHDGKVKQIVGGTLSESTPDTLKTNFVSRLVYFAHKLSQSAADFARLYREHNLVGGHVIKLGPGNDQAAREALAAWPGQLQIGGGITADNAQSWLDSGARKVIVTSHLFPGAKFSLERLQQLSSVIGKDRLVVDVSCRKRDKGWIVAMNKWQDLTDMQVSKENLDMLSEYCSEFLIHAADVEGLCQGIDEALVQKLGEWVRIPCTYAGGAKGMLVVTSRVGSDLGVAIEDLEVVRRLSGGRVDLTYGSSLDIFGGSLVRFDDLVRA